MPATVQLNTRIDPDLKRRGDIVFARAGLTPSEVVRAVWQTAAETQRVPECVAARQPSTEKDRLLKAIRDGAGLAARIAEEAGLHAGRSFDPSSCGSLHDEMYDDMLDAMEARRAEA